MSQAQVPAHTDGELPRGLRGASGVQASSAAPPPADVASTTAKLLRGGPPRFAASAGPAAPSVPGPPRRPGAPILARVSQPASPTGLVPPPVPERTAWPEQAAGPPQTAGQGHIAGAQTTEPAQTANAESAAAAEQPLARGRPAAQSPGAPGPVVPDLGAPGQQRTVRPARRWRLAGLVIAVVVLAAVATLILVVGSPSKATRTGNRPPANLVTVEAAVRSAAVAWVTSQVSRDTAIACDAPTCSDLAQHGFPAGNLNTLPSTAPDPYGSQLIIATAGIRSQFGAKLAAVFAPEVLASFGSGASQIDIRLIAPDGIAAFRSALSADEQARKSSGAQLLGNKRITAASTARTALASGDVDARLLTTLAFLAIEEPIDIVGFGSQAPGASPGVPLRTVDLAQTDPASRVGGSAYLRQLVSALHRQVPPYRPMSIAVVQLADGQSVLQVQFGAPTLFGLLRS